MSGQVGGMEVNQTNTAIKALTYEGCDNVKILQSDFVQKLPLALRDRSRPHYMGAVHAPRKHCNREHIGFLNVFSTRTLVQHDNMSIRNCG